MATEYDVAVLGGGVMGCFVALHLARAGMRVIVLEARDGVCTQASGVNTGHIAIMDGRTYRVPYAVRSMELWQQAAAWLGADVGYRTRGGLKLAFTDEETEAIASSAQEMRAHGAVLELIGANTAREREPALSTKVRAAVWSPADGYANPLQIADAFTAALRRERIEVWLGAPVHAIESAAPFRIATSRGSVRAQRLLIATGVRIGEITHMLDQDLPMVCRVSQVTVTERCRPVIGTAIGSASDTLSLKQVDNGTVLIGGGWQGIGSLSEGPREVMPEHVIGNLRLACMAIPKLSRARIVRTWLGLEARVSDNLPLNGALAGVPDAWVLGAVHTGFALSPAMGELMARVILGHSEPVPMFDPGRFSMSRSQAEAAHAG